jgi:hypothetical protein
MARKRNGVAANPAAAGKKGNSRKRKAIIVAMLPLLLTAAVATPFLLRGSGIGNDASADGGAPHADLNPSDVHDVSGGNNGNGGEDADGGVGAGVQRFDDRIAIPGTSKINVDADGTANVRFTNDARNTCRLKATLTLDENGRTLHETGWLEPGAGVYEINVGTLPHGNHPVTVTWEAASLEDGAPLNGASVQSTLTVG